MLSKKLKTIEELENAFKLTRVIVRGVASGLPIYKIGDQLYLDEFDFYEKLISLCDSDDLKSIEPILCTNKGEHEFHYYLDSRRKILKLIEEMDVLEFRILCDQIIPIGIRYAINPSKVIDFSNIKNEICENEKLRDLIDDEARVIDWDDDLFDFGDVEISKDQEKCTP